MMATVKLPNLPGMAQTGSRSEKMFLDREGENPPQEIATWPRNLAADLLQVQHPPKNEQVPVAESRPSVSRRDDDRVDRHILGLIGSGGRKP
jgi:hypothetical protein